MVVPKDIELQKHGGANFQFQTPNVRINAADKNGCWGGIQEYCWQFHGDYAATRLAAGNTVNMVRIIPTQAIELGTFEYVERAVASTKEKLNQNGCPQVQIGSVRFNLCLSWVSPVAVGGAAAGVVSTLICHPLEVLKDRLTVDPEVYTSIGQAISKIHREGGVNSFYAGISPTLIGMIPYSTCYYFMYDTIKK